MALHAKASRQAGFDPVHATATATAAPKAKAQVGFPNIQRAGTPMA